ncbi:hypothetical protein [Spirochaeta africana]|uniref:Uncharacterized protein n=1 Tax=Spirochaeta africana (strain ATCC 700263 / DSM 8902 / Z-7692) TaxID=889378 RepID=H9UIX9_SPIAZ|nr:hypothetical protein [Spirochaeta africana]AFG37472.1 hypothetical protein Spiaf_1409 [Spirochaeta africana DSM 8902]
MEDIIKHFYKELDVCSARSLDRIEYAFYLAMNLEDLCRNFIRYLSNTDVRNKLLRHINNRAQSKDGVIPSWFLEKLLNEFFSSVGRRRISLGTAIKVLRDYYTPEDLRDFFRWQIFSEGISDRKRAYHISEACYNDDVEGLLIKAWKKFGDEGSISVLVKVGSTEKIVDIFKEIWDSDKIKFYIKNEALKKVACFDFSRVSFIEEESPVSFLSASIAAGRNVTDEFVLSTARSADSINELGYILWCAGKLSKRDVILKLINEIEYIEGKLPLEFWELKFHGLA